MKLFAVIGKPILHNVAPVMWNNAFKGLGISAHYFRINPIDTEKAVKAIRELRLAGCNIAAPFKEDMLEYLDEADESVKVLGAVNTIKNDHGRLIGYNTDSCGVVRLLTEQGIEPEGKKVVVLGVDKTTRVVIYGLLKAKAQDIVILDRAYEKAIRAAERLGCRVAYFGRVKSEIKQADILISCLPSNRRIIKREWLHRKLAVFDASYSLEESRLIEDARKIGCQAIPASNQFIYEAVPAFERFFNVNPAECMKDAVHIPAKNVTESIAIIGFMGAGKTMVSRHLATLTGMEIVDTDTLIEEKAGESIPEIFRKYGETKFRELEHSIFESLDFKGKIISCGGGAVKNESTRTLLRNHSTVIWIWSSLSTIVSRIKKGTRPLLDVQNIEEKAKSIFVERIPLYADCTDLMMVNETVSTRNVAKRIYREIYETQ